MNPRLNIAHLQPYGTFYSWVLQRSSHQARNLILVIKAAQHQTCFKNLKLTLKMVSAVTLAKRSAFKCSAEDELNRE